MKSLIESLGLVGLYPEPIGATADLLLQSSPKLKPFFLACFDGDGDNMARVVSYLETMLGHSALAADVAQVVVDMKGRVRLLPMSLLAYSCHLNHTAFKSNEGAFSVSLLGKGGAKPDYSSIPQFVDTDSQ
eukprot:scaffold10827_cov132-Skeletonema_dohrnii-CCMP3373.AAC.1